MWSRRLVVSGENCTLSVRQHNVSQVLCYFWTNMHIKTKQKWLHQHSLTLWLKGTQIAFFSQFKKVHLLELTASIPLMATMGNMLTAACFKTCLDLKDVWDHSWGKWTRLDFPMLLFSTLLTGNENLFAGHWWVVGRHTYLCLAKEKKEIKHKNCWQFCYVEFQKIVCILNGVCCAIVHLHC